MGRKKIKIEKIQNERNRQVTFNKRKNGLIKKAMELTLLCDCEIALVIFNSQGKLYEYSTEGVENVVRRYAATTTPPQESYTSAEYDRLYIDKDSKATMEKRAPMSAGEVPAWHVPHYAAKMDPSKVYMNSWYGSISPTSPYASIPTALKNTKNLRIAIPPGREAARAKIVASTKSGEDDQPGDDNAASLASRTPGTRGMALHSHMSHMTGLPSPLWNSYHASSYGPDGLLSPAGLAAALMQGMPQMNVPTTSQPRKRPDADSYRSISTTGEASPTVREIEAGQGLAEVGKVRLSSKDRGQMYMELASPHGRARIWTPSAERIPTISSAHPPKDPPSIEPLLPPAAETLPTSTPAVSSPCSLPPINLPGSTALRGEGEPPQKKPRLGEREEGSRMKVESIERVE